MVCVHCQVWAYAIILNANLDKAVIYCTRIELSIQLLHVISTTYHPPIIPLSVWADRWLKPAMHRPALAANPG